MNYITELKTKVEAITPPGYSYIEDTVRMMQRVQEMQARSKAENLSSYGGAYGGADFDKVMKLLAESITTELESQKQFFLSNQPPIQED